MKVFEIGLFSIICLCAVILAYYKFVKPELAKRDPEPLALDYARSFFPVLLLVFLLRSFIAEPFRIPSGSMLSNLEIGDFILVNKFAYGIRLPIIHKKIIETGSPDRGDIVVFRYPPAPDQNYIKRLIGLPGDVVTYDYRSKQLAVNGQILEKKLGEDYFPFGSEVPHKMFTQTITRSDGDKVSFPILNFAVNFSSGNGKRSWTVPDGHFFVMGDNRDNSQDGRKFGYVPDQNVVGKAFFIWMHYGFSRDARDQFGNKLVIPGDGFKPSRIGHKITADKVEVP